MTSVPSGTSSLNSFAANIGMRMHPWLNPEVKIIAASGLTAGHKSGEASLEGVKIFLSKPYTAESLLKAIAEILKTKQS
jgi:CheY-like chemotaxis protein